MRAYVIARETLLVRDGDDWFQVRCAWGTDPGSAFLPSASTWDLTVPDWLRGRRGEVAGMIREFGMEVANEDQVLAQDAFGRGEDPDSQRRPHGQVETLPAEPIRPPRRFHQ